MPISNGLSFAAMVVQNDIVQFRILSAAQKVDQNISRSVQLNANLERKEVKHMTDTPPISEGSFGWSSELCDFLMEDMRRQILIEKIFDSIEGYLEAYQTKAKS